jgi:energy-coupling factor transporter ATP-binding protein EcfA2
LSAPNTEVPGSFNPESAAMSSIVTWSADLPAWQRDALRRLCLNEVLDAADVDELTAICKRPKGSSDPLTLNHIRAGNAGSAAVTLKAIRDVENVNALATGQSLSFVKTGITVAYGDNGSGKSGYARILKKACRARLSRKDEILTNVYARNPGVAAASVDFSVSDVNAHTRWQLNGATDPRLSAISVFDSRSASIQVEQSNDVAYTPLPLKVLASLADSCGMLKQRLNEAIKALEKQTPSVISAPTCKPTTTVGKLMAGLATATSVTVDNVRPLSTVESERLAALEADLAADPTRLSRQLLAHKSKLDVAATRLEAIQTALAPESTIALRAAYVERRASQSAALVASTDLFASEPLPAIGSDTWRALWEAARRYSEGEAYLERPFPVTDEGARCVLCLQELQPPAADRFQRFEAFVRNESKRREADALEKYNDAVLALDKAIVGETEQGTFTTLFETELADSELSAAVSAFLSNAMAVYRTLKESHAGESFTPAERLQSPASLVRAAGIQLQTRATALTSSDASIERGRLIAERDELVDRAWFVKIKSDVHAELSRRQQIAALQVALKDTATNKITAKTGELAEKLVTNALRSKFAQEINRLGVAGLAIELRQDKTTQGVPYFKVSLISQPNASVGEVLSEGEHRCVAIAAFLAEVGMTQGCSGLVFDDPVSSLDHMHREAVAVRLAEEAAHRQVIVFTHDLAFLMLLSEECRRLKTTINFRNINRGKTAAGYCDLNGPNNTKSILQIIEGLSKHLQNTKVQHEQGKRAEWDMTSRSLLEQLRTAWERAVEDALAPVVKRLANKVDTKNLLKLTVLTREDCATMRLAFGRCSALLHSDADAMNRPAPTPEQIEAEVLALSKWFEDIKTRQDDVRVD